MKILVSCERSGKVRRAFQAKGHEVYSCDIVPADDGELKYHIQCDVSTLLTKDHKWDRVIAFPPCTDLCVSGARHFAEKRRDGRQAKSIAFFSLFTKLDFVPQVAIENPVGIMSTLYRKPDQIIHPWMFGHSERKKTCLWLKNLPILVPTNIVERRSNRLHKLWGKVSHKELSIIRSETFQGIADAMAEQWG